MRLLKNLDKQPRWSMTFVNGIPQTGYDGWARSEEGDRVEYDMPVPIVRLSLTLSSWSRGRSSATFEFKDIETGAMFSAAMQASFEMFKQSKDGSLEGLFTFKKQGSQVSIYPYTEEEFGK
jgi:hypothetical protein